MVGSIRLVRVTLTSLAIVAGLGLSLPPSGNADDEPAEQDKAREQTGKGGTANEDNAGKAASTVAVAITSRSLQIHRSTGRRPAAAVRAAPSRDGRRSAADRGRATLQRGPCPGRSARLDRRGGPASRSARSSIPTRSRSPAACAGFMSVPWVGPTWPCNTASVSWPIEPGDTETLTRLVDYYKKNDPAGAEATLERGSGQSQARCPRAGPAAGRVRAGQTLLRPAPSDRQGGRRFAKVIEALDDKSANRLSARRSGARSGQRPVDGLPRTSA